MSLDTLRANGLAKLLEELGELSQVCAKKLAYYHTDEHPDGAGSLRERMQEEIADVAAAMLFEWDGLCKQMDEECPEWREGFCIAPKTYDTLQRTLYGARRTG